MTRTVIVHVTDYGWPFSSRVLWARMCPQVEAIARLFKYTIRTVNFMFGFFCFFFFKKKKLFTNLVMALFYNYWLFTVDDNFLNMEKKGKMRLRVN